ncbi:MAG: substrate-binding domain-containing protein [Pseudomonadota bacterium]
MSNKAVNLKELALHLGLSQTTVSRALNGFPEVSERTRQRVQEVAAELNYRPSLSATSLATGKTKVIGHVVQVSQHRMINPHFSDFLAGASETYAAAGYDMLLRAAAPEDEAGLYRDFASRKRVDAVVVHGPMVDEPRIELLKNLRLPFLVHGRCGRDIRDYAFLDVNNKTAFETLTNHLIELGHRRIALINGLETMNFAQRRRAGFEAALRTHGLTVDPELMFSADMTEPYGHTVAGKMLDSTNPPTAIMCSSILSAIGVQRAISERGLTLGSDISIATYDDLLSFLMPSDGEEIAPFMTSMQSSIQAAGRRAAEILLNQINDPETPVVQEVWNAKFIKGRTTGRPVR